MESGAWLSGQDGFPSGSGVLNRYLMTGALLASKNVMYQRPFQLKKLMRRPDEPLGMRASLSGELRARAAQAREVSELRGIWQASRHLASIQILPIRLVRMGRIGSPLGMRLSLSDVGDVAISVLDNAGGVGGIRQRILPNGRLVSVSRLVDQRFVSMEPLVGFDSVVRAISMLLSSPTWATSTTL